MLYSTEEQQAEVLQKFWKQNGKTIMFGLVLGIACILGWQYFKKYQLQQMESNTEQYMYSFEKINNNYNEATVKSLDDFIQMHRSDSYGQMAAFNLASLVADRGGDYESAEKYLQIAAESKDSAVSNVARLRLARVQIQLKKFDEAKKTLSSVKSSIYQSSVNEILGDIAFVRGDLSEARKSYQAAYDLIKGTNEENLNIMLKRKLDDLAVGTAAPKAGSDAGKESAPASDASKDESASEVKAGTEAAAESEKSETAAAESKKPETAPAQNEKSE
jgi:predicted negative regulator of RcsB-dependent stress response